LTTSTAQKKRPNQRARIRLAAVDLLQQHPEGLTYTELVQAMRQLHPDRNLKSLSNDVVNLDRHFPSKVYQQVARWRPPHVHLCNHVVSFTVGIASCLILATAIDVLRVTIAVLAPVVWVPIEPCLLGSGLVVSIGRVGRALESLPAFSPLALASRRTAEVLIGRLQQQSEPVPASDAASGAHGLAPFSSVRIPDRGGSNE
jgi:hypothetical protein